MTPPCADVGVHSMTIEGLGEAAGWRRFSARIGSLGVLYGRPRQVALRDPEIGGLGVVVRGGQGRVAGLRGAAISVIVRIGLLA